jgi:hypothetical protein
MDIVCSTKAAMQDARIVLIRHGVDMRRVKEQGPFQSNPPDPTSYLVVDYTLSEQQATQIRDALSRVAGVTVAP